MGAGWGEVPKAISERQQGWRELGFLVLVETQSSAAIMKNRTVPPNFGKTYLKNGKPDLKGKSALLFAVTPNNSQNVKTVRVGADQKMWYTHKMEYYSALKKEILTGAYVGELPDRVTAATLTLIARLEEG